MSASELSSGMTVLITATEAALAANPAALLAAGAAGAAGAGLAAEAAGTGAAHESTAAEAARHVCEALVGPMRGLLAEPNPLPDGADQPLDGAAVGNLVYEDPDRRFHILAVVFPEGTSSGVHHHGCWGVIGYLRGGDEESRYREVESADPRVDLEEVSRHVWHQGDVTMLLPPADGWHRVRNPGPGTGVSIHVLCRTPAEHPHRFWERGSGAVLPFPFREAAPGRWRAVVERPD